MRNWRPFVAIGFPALLLAWTAFSQQMGPGQTPMTGTPPKYMDPNDPDGPVEFPNKTGRTIWKRQGVWKARPVSVVPGTDARGVPAVTAAETQSMRATLEVVSQTLRATPRGTDLSGYWMNEPRRILYPNRYDLPPEVALASVPFQFESSFYPFYLEEVLVNGAYKPQWGGETDGIYFIFNRLPGNYGRTVIAEEPVPSAAPRKFYLAPRVTGRFRDLPVYEDQDLVILRQNRSPWMPVAYGRLLKAALPLYEKDRLGAENRLANLRKQNDETQAPAYEQKMREHLEKYSGQYRTTDPKKWEGRLAGMERELRYNREVAARKANPQRGDKEGAWYWNPIDAHAQITAAIAALTPGDSNTPACYLPATERDGRYVAQGRILPVGASTDPACVPVVTDNHGYFDPKLPRSAPQIMQVWVFGRCGKVVDGNLRRAQFRSDGVHPPQGCDVHAPIWEAADWRRIAGLIVP